MKNLILVLVSIIFCSCAGVKIPKDSAMEDYFFISESKASTNSKWVVFLPGSSGLDIYEDTQHYFNQAKKLNENNLSVLLIDYKKAYKASGRKVKESTGEKINWTLGRAITWVKRKNNLDKEKFALVGWSLAGEGLSSLLNDKSKLVEMGIEAVAMYYPSNQKDISVQSELPVLIQTGSADNVTTQKAIEKTFSKNTNMKIIIFENAHHGFDIQSLEEGKTIRLPPLVGKKYSMKYNEKAAKESSQNLIQFLKNNF